MRSVISADGIEPPTTRDRITSLGNGDALVVRTCLNIAPGKIRDDEAIVPRIINDRRVATMEIVAGRAGIRIEPKTVERESGERASGGLVVDSDRGIYRLHEMIWTDI